jgi:dihydroxy-acid dehydratase
LVEDDDEIEIDAVENKINLKVSDEVIAVRRKNWKQPALKATKGVLYKYAHCVSSASEGCVTDEFKLNSKVEELSKEENVIAGSNN